MNFYNFPTYTVTIKTKDKETFLFSDTIQDGVEDIFIYVLQKSGVRTQLAKDTVAYLQHSAEKITCIEYWNTFHENNSQGDN
jgi:hypothetical protein